MRIIEVMLDDQSFDTIFWYGKNDSLADIKKCLVDHDGYDSSINVQEVVDEEVFW